nr:helix-turn-helix domain-containing protein [Kribbella sp. VKM Ac-2527]
MYPTPAQQLALLTQCGQARHGWNLGLAMGLFDLDRARHAVSACGVGARGL